jgi:hypothetical protein
VTQPYSSENLDPFSYPLLPRALPYHNADHDFFQGVHNTITMEDVPSVVKTWNSLGVETIVNPVSKLSVFCLFTHQLIYWCQYAGFKSGLYNVRISMNQGTRSYAATEYYCPSSNRRNLHVLTQAQVRRCLSLSNFTLTTLGRPLVLSSPRGRATGTLQQPGCSLS